MAVRLSRPYDHGPGDDRLLPCEICGGRGGTSACEPLLIGGQAIGACLLGETDRRRPPRSDARVRRSGHADPRQPAQPGARRDASRQRRAHRPTEPERRQRHAQPNRSASRPQHQPAGSDHARSRSLQGDQRPPRPRKRRQGTRARRIHHQLNHSPQRLRRPLRRRRVSDPAPDTDREGAIAVAERVRTAIQNAVVTGLGALAAGLGVAVLPTNASDAAELLRTADRALYTAKETAATASTPAQPQRQRGCPAGG